MSFFRTLLIFVFVCFLLSINGTYAENNARKDFQNALELSLNDLNGAEKAFKDFKLKYPDNNKIRDAEYWLARILFRKKKYPQSALAFAEFNAKYPDDKRYTKNLLFIAEASVYYAPSKMLCKILKQTIEDMKVPILEVSSRIKLLQKLNGCNKKEFKSASKPAVLGIIKSNKKKNKIINSIGEKDTPFSKNEIVKISDQVKKCWIAPSSYNDLKVPIKLKTFLDTDGNVKNIEIIDVASYKKDPVFRANADAARRAIKDCSPIVLSRKLFNDKNVVLNFLPSKEILSANLANERPLKKLSDTSICYNATTTSGGKKVWNDRNENFVGEAKYRDLDCAVKGVKKTVTTSKPKITKPSISSAELEKEKQKRKLLEQKLASLEQEKEKRIEEERKRKELEKKLAALQSEKKKQIKKAKQNEIGSGFYVSKFRHIVTNQHVVNKCNKITVGDSMTTQIPADLIASDKRNDLAILQTISMDMASAETKSFIQNLSIQIVPIVSGGLIRIEDVKGGEQVYVAGFPHGNMISDSMRLVPGLVNSTRGFENDITQFETDAVIRKGNSGGPVYDSKGNIVGIAVKRFNVTRSDNYNFAIKGSTVKQFLDAHNILTTPANRTSSMTSTKIYNIASKQTVMVVCHR